MNSLFAPSPASEFVSPCFQVGGGREGSQFSRETCQSRYHTYVCRVQSSFWRLPKYWLPTPSPRVCPLSAPKAGGLHSRRVVRGSILWKTPDIGLASSSKNSLRYDPSTFEDSSPSPAPPPRLLVPAHFLLTYASVNYCDIFVQYYAAKKNTPNCTYAMSHNILNVPTGTNFAGFFYTNKSMLH